MVLACSTHMGYDKHIKIRKKLNTRHYLGDQGWIEGKYENEY